MRPPKIVIIAGPNGAGKTTFARAFLPQEAQLPRFINADLIAAGLSPFAPDAAAIRAGRLMLDEIAACSAKMESFAFETTLSGLGYLRHIREWKDAGYHVSRFFLALPNASGKAGTTFQKTSYGDASHPAAAISTGTTAIRWIPGHFTTTPATSRLSSSGENRHDQRPTIAGQGQGSSRFSDRAEASGAHRKGNCGQHRHSDRRATRSEAATHHGRRVAQGRGEMNSTPGRGAASDCRGTTDITATGGSTRKTSAAKCGPATDPVGGCCTGISYRSVIFCLTSCRSRQKMTER